MKITKNRLKSLGACVSGVVWFEENFGKKTTSKKLVEKLQEEKKYDWLDWVYVNCKLSGLCESWYENGQLAYRKNYKAGKEDGLWESWYENGKLEYRANYKAGKEDGLCERWYENGKLEYRRNYKAGKIISEVKNE